MDEIPVEEATEEQIDRTWGSWGMPIVSVGRHYWPRAARKGIDGIALRDLWELVESL